MTELIIFVKNNSNILFSFFVILRQMTKMPQLILVQQIIDLKYENETKKTVHLS